MAVRCCETFDNCQTRMMPKLSARSTRGKNASAPTVGCDSLFIYLAGGSCGTCCRGCRCLDVVAILREDVFDLRVFQRSDGHVLQNRAANTVTDRAFLHFGLALLQFDLDFALPLLEIELNRLGGLSDCHERDA